MEALLPLPPPKSRHWIRAVKRDNLRGLLGIKRMDIVSNARIRELCGVTKEVDEKMVTKGVDERIGEGVLLWFGHVERMEEDMIAKRVYVGECAGSRSVGRPWKRWIDAVNDCLRKRGLDIGQGRRMVHDRGELQGFVRGNAWGIAR